MARCFLLLHLLLVTAYAVVPSLASTAENQCVYTVYVRTGGIIKAGTDSTIGVMLGDAQGREFKVPDLVKWGGLIGSGYNYFERGALDVFSGRGPCGFDSPVCSLNLTSEGAGAHHSWYCEYVEVTSTGPHFPCAQTIFYVRQWIATDAPPYKLYATVDSCNDEETRRRPATTSSSSETTCPRSSNLVLLS